MNQQQIYEPKWCYDYWANIERVCPIGSTITCKVTSIKPNYAFLKTKEGLNCFLGKDKISSPWRITDLTQILSSDIEYECSVSGYNFEKRGLVIALNLHH